MTVQTTAHVPPAAYRATLDATIRRVARVAFEACDPTARGVMATALGIARQRVDEWLAPDGRKRLSASDLCVAPLPVRRAVCEEVMGPGYVIADLPTADVDVTHMRSLADSVTSHAAAIAAYARAVADSTITPAEGREIEARCRLAMRDLATMEAAGRAAARVAPVSPLRKVGA